MEDIRIILAAQVEQFKRAMADAEQALTSFQTKAEKGLKAADQAALPAAAAFATLAAGIGVAVSQFATFEASLNGIKAVSGATAAEMDKIKQTALDLGAQTQFSAKQAADGMSELLKAGMSVQQSLDAINGTMSLAAAGQLGVGRAAEITAAALNGFGLAADQAGRVADLLATAANASALDVGDVAESLKFASTVAASTSQSLESVVAMLATMGNAGIKGSQGGTIFRAAIASLAKPSEDAQQKLHDLTISIQDTSGKMLPLADIVGQLRDKTANMTEVQRANTIATIFGQEAMSGILAVMKQTPEQMAAVAKQFNNVTGAAKEQASVMTGGLKGAFEQLSGSVETAGTLMGEQFAPSGQAAAGAVQGLVDGFSRIDPATKTLIAGAAAASLALTGLVAIAGTAGVAITGLIISAELLGVALGPIGLGIAALSTTVGVATMVMKAHADAQRRAEEAVKAHDKAQIDAVRTNKDSLDKLQALVAEHDALADKTNRSKAETERLKALNDQMLKDYPDLASAIKAAGDKHWAAVDAVNAEINAKRKLNEENRRLANWELYSANKDYEAAYSKLTSLQSQRASALPGYSPYPGMGSTGAMNDALISAQEAVVTKLAKAQAAAKSRFDATMAIVDPKPVKEEKLNRDGGVDAPGGGKKAKDAAAEADKAERELHQRRQDRINDLTRASERLTERQQAWGMGESVRLKNLETLYAAIKAQFGGTLEGAKALADLEQTITVLKGKQAVAAKEAAEAAAKQAEKDKTDKAFQWLDYDAQIAAYVKKQQEDQKKAAEEAAAAYRRGIREIQGDLTALALDPSLERVANMAKALVADEEKLKQYADTIAKIGKAYNDAGQGVDGVSAAFKSASGEVDWLSVSVLAAAEAVMALKEAFDRAEESRKRFADITTSSGLSAQRTRAQMIDDPMKRAEATRDSELADAKAEFDGKAKKAMDDWAASPWLVDAFLAAGQSMAAEYQAQVDAINKKFEDAKASASASWVSMADEMTDAMGKATEATKALADAQGELDGGGRDDYGNRISLAAERDLKIDQARAAAQERINDLTERQKEIREEIQKINRKEAADIAKIQNEGIAVRALSEAQDKTQRIEQVKTEAAEKRTAAEQEIVDIDTRIAKEAEARDKQISNLRILADEKINQLQRERDEQRRLLAVEQARYATALALASVYGVSVGTPNVTFPTVNYAAEGGEAVGGIPGKDSIPAMLMPGEVVVSTEVTNGIKALVKRMNNGTLAPAFSRQAMTMPGGGNTTISVTIGDVVVQGDRSGNPAGTARNIRSALNAELRQMGPGFRV